MSKYSLEDLRNLTHTSTDFDCNIRSYQVKKFIEFFQEQGNNTFSCKDISDMFINADMNSPRRNKKIRCSANKVREYIDMLIRHGDLKLEKISETEFNFESKIQ